MTDSQKWNITWECFGAGISILLESRMCGEKLFFQANLSYNKEQKCFYKVSKRFLRQFMQMIPVWGKLLKLVFLEMNSENILALCLSPDLWVWSNRYVTMFPVDGQIEWLVAKQCSCRHSAKKISIIMIIQLKSYGDLYF